jgi:hypothetical protein
MRLRLNFTKPNFNSIRCNQINDAFIPFIILFKFLKVQAIMTVLTFQFLSLFIRIISVKKKSIISFNIILFSVNFQMTTEMNEGCDFIRIKV